LVRASAFSFTRAGPSGGRGVDRIGRMGRGSAPRAALAATVAAGDADGANGRTLLLRAAGRVIDNRSPVASGDGRLLLLRVFRTAAVWALRRAAACGHALELARVALLPDPPPASTGAPSRAALGVDPLVTAFVSPS
jgi:hypothetical protein